MVNEQEIGSLSTTVYSTAHNYTYRGECRITVLGNSRKISFKDSEFIAPITNFPGSGHRSDDVSVGVEPISSGGDVPDCRQNKEDQHERVGIPIAVLRR